MDQLRYPPQPASSVYRPESDDIARVVLGELQHRGDRALDVATLSNRPSVDVSVDGHAIVTRHLAILAMTGAGKSWTARRIIEQLAAKNYPIVIFDPHGDYTGLAEIASLRGRVRRYHAQFPIFEQAPETVMSVVEALGWPMAKTHSSHFDELFKGAQTFISGAPEKLPERTKWLASYLRNDKIAHYGLKPNMYFFADFVQAVVEACKREDAGAVDLIVEWCGREQLRIKKQTAGWLEGLPGCPTALAPPRRVQERRPDRSGLASLPPPPPRRARGEEGRAFAPACRIGAIPRPLLDRSLWARWSTVETRPPVRLRHPRHRARGGARQLPCSAGGGSILGRRPSRPADRQPCGAPWQG